MVDRRDEPAARRDLAVLIKFGMDPVFAGIWVGVAGHMLLGVGMYLLTYAIFRTRLAALMGAACIAFMPYTAMDAGNGLETSLFMAFMAFLSASLYAWKTRRAAASRGGSSRLRS